MRTIIVNNPKQKGATDGAESIFRALKALHPELDIICQTVNNLDEITEEPDIVCSVGPDKTNLVLEICEKFSSALLVGVKDPFKETPSQEAYDPWRFICDTMGTMADSEILKLRPDLVYIPPFPPFSMTKKDLEEARQSPYLEAFKPDITVVIGGADPYTNYDLNDYDLMAIYNIIERLDESFGNKIAFITSPRTSAAILDSLSGWDRIENIAVYDFQNKKLHTGNKVIDCENFYRPAISVSDVIIATDDSLSTVAEVSVAETKVIIYETYNTAGWFNGIPAPRRKEVDRNVMALSGATLLNWQVTWDNEDEKITISHPTKSLEGIVDKDIAERLYQAIIKNLKVQAL